MLLAGGATGTSETVEVVSPNGQIQFQLTASDHLNFAVKFKGRLVIEPSPLAVLLNGKDITEGAKLGDVKRSEIREKYATRGVHSEAVNHCMVLNLPVTHRETKTTYIIEVRVFDDGIGFRQIIPADESPFGARKPREPNEATLFRIPDGSTTWFHDLGGHYEAVHEKYSVGSVKTNQWAAPPVTIKLPANTGYAALTEAALVNYPGMAFKADGQRGFQVVLAHNHPISYPYRLRYSNDIERVTRPAAISGTITSPWRVIMIGEDLNTLVNCDIVQNLCPPPNPKLFPNGINTAWIKPGRAVWKYLDGGPSTLEGMKDFCKWAGELGFEYNIIEGFWRRWTDKELRELVEYGRQQHVGIWLWRHSKELRDPRVRKDFFISCREAGVAGVKLDFFDHEAKEVIDFYQTLLRETAENTLLVNFHGANKPAGESRTWPNELCREAIRGMESSRLQTRARHDATLPFTRFLGGHADYTPVHFGARRGDTTWAHQVATAAVFTAPLLTYGAHPTNILSNPALPMIKSIPAVWDETAVLADSEIGEVAAFARRSGQTWFLAILNGPEARTLKVPLKFLGDGEYKTLVVHDDKTNSAALSVENGRAKRDDAVTVEMMAGGGFIARFSKN